MSTKAAIEYLRREISLGFVGALAEISAQYLDEIEEALHRQANLADMACHEQCGDCAGCARSAGPTQEPKSGARQRRMLSEPLSATGLPFAPHDTQPRAAGRGPTGGSMMLTPTYIPDYQEPTYEIWKALEELPWVRIAGHRKCFMSDEPRTYTYGKGRGIRSYRSVPLPPLVRDLMDKLNRDGHAFNVCFANEYVNHRDHLGWRSDDHPDQDHPIGVVSYGAARNIWWRRLGESGLQGVSIQTLEPGSLFLMPPGFQSTHEHRIPKHDRPIAARISLTFRRILRA